jgi:hypothetical protein
MITTTKKIVSLSFALFLFAFFSVATTASFAAMDNPEVPEEEEEKEEVTFPFPNEDLINFFDTNQELSIITRSSQEKMAEAAKAHNLTLERFNQIANANKIGALNGGAFTDEEIEAFVALGPEVSNIQREQQQLIQAKLQEMGFTPQSYQEILTAYRTDQELQAHVVDLLRERRKQEILEERRRAAEEKAAEEAGNQ